MFCQQLLNEPKKRKERESASHFAAGSQPGSCGTGSSTRVLRVEHPQPHNSSIGSCGTGSSTRVLRVEDPQPRNISSIGSCGTGSSTRVLRVEDPQLHNISIGSCGTGSSTRSCGSKTRSYTGYKLLNANECHIKNQG